MRHPKANVLLTSEPFPRSYQELQTLVEVKVRNLCLERHVPPVVRHEELIDYVRSLMVANPNGLDQDEEEFNLACCFLNEAGAIVHFKSQQSGVSDLCFLDPQWMFNALASVIRGIKQGRQSAVVQGGSGHITSGLSACPRLCTVASCVCWNTTTSSSVLTSPKTRIWSHPYCPTLRPLTTRPMTSHLT